MKNAAYQRIATEEAFAPAEMLAEYRKLLEKSDVDPGFKGLMGFYMTSPSARARVYMRTHHNNNEAVRKKPAINHQPPSLSGGMLRP